MSILFGCLIHIGKMLRDSCVGIKTIHYIKHLCILWCLLRQIGSTATAENHYINFIFPLFYFIHRADLGTLCQNRNSFRCSSCEYSCQLHVRILLNGALYAASQVSISHNTNLHFLVLHFIKKHQVYCTFLSKPCQLLFINNTADPDTLLDHDQSYPNLQKIRRLYDGVYRQNRKIGKIT